MKICSLFDGFSGAQLALHKAGIEYDKYFASEVDEPAIKITQKNFPDTVQLGDVRDVSSANLPKIDLLVGGSPCQGFSFASKDRLNFDDPRSALFFEYVRLLKELQPKWFLLENVKMKKESEAAITDLLGVEPIKINSNIVSAQNRQRLYWTNIPVTVPDDKGIMLKDIIECGHVDRDKSYCIDANYFRGGNLKRYFARSSRQLVFSDPVIVQRPRGANKGGIRAVDGKVPTLSASSWQYNNFLVYPDTLKFRKLTVKECERLQTVPEGYTEGVSNTQRYKMLGNGFTVDVVAHILKGIKR